MFLRKANQWHSILTVGLSLRNFAWFGSWILLPILPLTVACRSVSKCDITLAALREPQVVCALAAFLNSSVSFRDGDHIQSLWLAGEKEIPCSITVHTKSHRSCCFFIFSHFALWWRQQMTVPFELARYSAEKHISIHRHFTHFHESEITESNWTKSNCWLPSVQVFSYH
jgi:hypothetical protein